MMARSMALHLTGLTEQDKFHLHSCYSQTKIKDRTIVLVWYEFNDQRERGDRAMNAFLRRENSTNI